jgi:hypothetical protein
VDKFGFLLKISQKIKRPHPVTGADVCFSLLRFRLMFNQQQHNSSTKFSLFLYYFIHSFLIAVKMATLFLLYSLGLYFKKAESIVIIELINRTQSLRKGRPSCPGT